MVKLLESNVDYRTAGDYTIQVEVSNSLGDTTQAELPVHIVEASRLSTDIHLTQSLVYLKKGAEFHPEDYVDYVEDMDGNQLDAGSLSISSQVNTGETGTYQVQYQTDGDTGRGVTWLTVIVRE